MKRVRAIRQGRTAAQTDTFLIEGIHPIGVAIERGWDVELLLYAPELLASEYGRSIVDRFRGRTEAVSSEIFVNLATKERPQGIVAIARRKHRFLRDVQLQTFGVAVVHPQDPGNVGTILRTLDASGGSALFLLDGGADPYHPTAVRAGMGGTFTVPFVQCGFTEFWEWARQGAIEVIGTSAHAALRCADHHPAPPWIVLLGNEQKGLSPEQLAVCGTTVTIPMRGSVSSLNLAVAAGVFLYEWGVRSSQGVPAS